MFSAFYPAPGSAVRPGVDLSTFSRDLGGSVPTVKSWLSVLEAGRIIYLLPPYHSNLGKRISKAPKLYFLDIGLVCYLTGIKDDDHLSKGPLSAALFENFCVQETVKMFFHHGRRPNLYFLRTQNQLEVDLLIEESFQALIPVELKMMKTPHPSMGAAIGRFRKLFAGWNIKPGMIVFLVDQSVPLSDVFSATTFPDYLSTLET